MIKKHIFKMFMVFVISYPVVGQDDFEKWLKKQEADLTEVSEGEVKALATITKEFEKNFLSKGVDFAFNKVYNSNNNKG